MIIDLFADPRTIEVSVDRTGRGLDATTTRAIVSDGDVEDESGLIVRSTRLRVPTNANVDNGDRLYWIDRSYELTSKIDYPQSNSVLFVLKEVEDFDEVTVGAI